MLKKVLLDWLSGIPTYKWLSKENIEKDFFPVLENLGWQKKILGKSQKGNDIVCFCFGNTSLPKLNAYGYPHPDEPIGATALVAFAIHLAKTKPDFLLHKFCFEIVFIADPDGAENNEIWIEDFSLKNFARQNWRPIWSGLEVDYAFPVEWDVFFHPPTFVHKDVFSPLPESCLLANWLKASQPIALGLFHNEHISGAYNFFSFPPGKSTQSAFEQAHEFFAIKAHLGDQPDPGKKWFKQRSDFLRETTLQEEKKKLQRKFGALQGKKFAGCISVEQFLSYASTHTKIITPEIGLWYSPFIDSLEDATVAAKKIVKNNKVYLQIPLPDQQKVEIYYGNFEFVKNSKTAIALTSLAQAKHWHFLSKQIWQKNKDKVADTVRAKDYQQNIKHKKFPFSDYRKKEFASAATLAWQSDWNTRVRFQTLQEIGWGLQVYEEADLMQAVEEQTKLFEDVYQSLNAVKATDPHNACGDVLFRWIFTGFLTLNNIKQ